MSRRLRETVIPQPEREKVDPSTIDPAKPVALAVLAVRGSTARSILPGTQREITLRSGDLWNVVPGDVVTVQPKKVWTYFRHSYLSGRVLEHHLETSAFGLTPLGLTDLGIWDPKDHDWGEEGEALEEWAVPVYESGPRPEVEFEQVIPGEDPENPDSDPITDAADFHEGGAFAEAWELLMDVLQADLRCLDAHAHLGNFTFHLRPKDALRHYEAGLRVGELSLGPDFRGLLPWSAIDNRPFLRCLHGYGLCLWRLGRYEEAAITFERMLWLNPSDNQGARFLLPAMREKKEWTPEG